MRKKGYTLLAAAAIMLLCGCGNKEQASTENVAAGTTAADSSVSTEAVDIPEKDTEQVSEEASASASTEGAAAASLSDGTYMARFETDGSMFHVNETMNGKGILTVSGGKMMIHLVMPSKNTVNLFVGLADDAKKDGAELLQPTVEKVTYSDGTTEEVNAFDLPVPVLEQEYDVALIGTKGKWYDHKVKVTDPEPYEGSREDAGEIRDGEYTIEASVEGGTGKAAISSPAKLSIAGGRMTLQVEWSSPHYDYMIVDGEKYLPVNKEGNSVFLIPVKDVEKDMTVIADTTAMSEPHEIEYVLHLNPGTLK